MKGSRLILLFGFVLLVFFVALPALADDSDSDTDCDDNGDCAKTEFCSKPIGECDEDGRCAQRPEICTDEFDPVCGCDGRTYGNACNAAAAGVSIASEGECKANCEDNDDCAKDQFCKFRGMGCEGEGMCEMRPEVCIQIFDPVCGCDGKTYSNNCFAFMAGTNVAHEGECRPDYDD